VSAKGRVYRRCACRGDGKQLGQSCPQLAASSKHGTWSFAVDVPNLNGKRSTMRRSGFPTKAAASAALDAVNSRLHVGVQVDDRETVAGFLGRWLEAKAREGKPTTMRAYRAYVDNDLIPALGTLPIERLRAEHVERFLGAYSTPAAVR
jgi:hypothetical protein